jgi:hypothetical protein
VSRRARPVRNAPAWGDVATCAGKIPFFDRRTAKRRAAELRDQEGDGIRAYRRSACGYWHLGHEPGQWTGLRHADRIFQTPDRRGPA